MFSSAVSIGSRLKNWKMKPMCLPPDLRDVLVAQLSEPGAGDRDVAVGRAVERRQDVHQRRLAGARRAHDRRQLALLDVQRDAAQRVDCRVALSAPVDVVCGDDRAVTCSVLRSLQPASKRES